MKNKACRAFPLGQEAGAYLRQNRGRLLPNTYTTYESCLDKFARHFCDLELADFEPPVGTERLEEFIDEEWGAASSEQRSHRIRSGRSSPKKRPPGLSGVAPLLREGIRKGALQAVQFRHFDHTQRRLTVFTNGGKVQTIPVVDPAFWNELERWILDWQAQPHEYLLCRRTVRPNRHNPGEKFVVEHRDEPMGGHGLHRWWYRCLANAGIVATGQISGERMHKARHTAGQRVLDHTSGNLKAVQKLLGHSSISTTGDIYTDWDIDQLAETLRDMLEQGEK